MRVRTSRLSGSFALPSLVRQERDPSRSIPTVRTGAAMVFALIALLVASAMIAAMLRLSSLSHRQLKKDEFRVQASLLVDAGFARADAKLRNQPDFADEVWNIPSEQLSFGRKAKVSLKVATDPAKPTGRAVTVVAEYPLDHPDIVRITRVLPVP